MDLLFGIDIENIPIARSKREPMVAEIQEVVLDFGRPIIPQADSTPVPTVQPQRELVASAEAESLAAAHAVGDTTAPVATRIEVSHSSALALSDAVYFVLSQAPPPLTYHSVRSCGPEVIPKRAVIVAMSSTLLARRSCSLAVAFTT